MAISRMNKDSNNNHSDDQPEDAETTEMPAVIRNEEDALVEALVQAEPLNIWSLLMPAIYQLVPGSLIAKLLFSWIK